MSEDKDLQRESKKEERDPLARVVNLAPLLSLVIEVIELILKILRIIK